MPSAADPATPGPNTRWIESLSPWPEEFGLERMQALSRELGDPQKTYPAVHVVGLDAVEYVGVHGLEDDPEARAFAPQLEAFAERIAWPWTVENKGGVTLSFHYREAGDEEGPRHAEEVAHAAEDAGLVPHRGRKVLEVRPPVGADKGTAVRRLLDGRPITRALYAGDDTTDLDAFRGLDDAGLDVALKVSVGSPEMNPALLTRADIVVEGPGELLAFLRTL